MIKDFEEKNNKLSVFLLQNGAWITIIILVMLASIVVTWSYEQRIQKLSLANEFLLASNDPTISFNREQLDLLGRYNSDLNLVIEDFLNCAEQYKNMAVCEEYRKEWVNFVFMNQIYKAMGGGSSSGMQ